MSHSSFKEGEEEGCGDDVVVAVVFVVDPGMLPRLYGTQKEVRLSLSKSKLSIHSLYGNILKRLETNLE